MCLARVCCSDKGKVADPKQLANTACLDLPSILGGVAFLAPPHGCAAVCCSAKVPDLKQQADNACLDLLSILSCVAFLAPPHGCAAVLQQERVINLKQQANTAALVASRCFAELGKQQSTSGQSLPLHLPLNPLLPLPLPLPSRLLQSLPIAPLTSSKFAKLPN